MSVGISDDLTPRKRAEREHRILQAQVLPVAWYERNAVITDATRGYQLVYVVQMETGPIKIGIAGSPLRRLEDLQSASPYALTLLRVLPGGDDRERRLHQRFAAHRMRGEWFKPCPALVKFATEFDRVKPPRENAA